MPLLPSTDRPLALVLELRLLRLPLFAAATIAGVLSLVACGSSDDTTQTDAGGGAGGAAHAGGPAGSAGSKIAGSAGSKIAAGSAGTSGSPGGAAGSAPTGGASSGAGHAGSGGSIVAGSGTGGSKPGGSSAAGSSAAGSPNGGAGGSDVGAAGAGPVGETPTPAITQMADSGSWEAPQAVYVSALPPVPHVCYSDGTKVGTQAEVPGGVDVEAPPGFPFSDTPTAAQAAANVAMRTCLRQRDIAYDADVATKLLGGADPLKVTYQWDFGDPGADYDQVAGISAAHLYTKAGTYVITLTITNELGFTGTTTSSVVIKPSTRNVVHIDAQADLDDLVGNKPAPNTEYLVKRGTNLALKTEITLASNDHFGNYGDASAAVPILTSNGPGRTFAINNGTLVHIVMEGFELRIQGATRPILSEPSGTNMVFKDITFTSGGDKGTAYTGPNRGFTLQGNGQLVQNVGIARAADGSFQSDGINSNFAFITATNVALYGNHVWVDSASGNAEPAIRTCGSETEFVSLVDNDVGGFWGKGSEITIRGGHSIYIGNNRVLGGTWNTQSACSPLVNGSESTTNVLIENNHTENAQLALSTDVFGVMVRNNFSHMGSTNAQAPTQVNIAVSVGNAGETPELSSARQSFVANTFIFEPNVGKIMAFGSSVDNATDLVDNLFYAPALSPVGKPIINMSSNDPALFAMFDHVEGNVFLLTPHPTLGANVIAGNTTFTNWNSVKIGAGTPKDQAFDGTMGGFAKAPGSGSEIDVDLASWRPLSSAPWASAAENLTPTGPDSDDYGVSVDFEGQPRPAAGSGGWTPGALVSQLEKRTPP